MAAEEELSIFHRLFCLLRPPPQLSPSSNPNPVVIPNDLIGEILKFLPVKSLMRFKCVSKDWLSIITDPSFTHAYPGGFRGPIVFRPRWVEYPYKTIHYLSIHDTAPAATCEAYTHSTVDHGGQSLAHTAVVDGLICFFNPRGNTSWLYNIATRERVQLPNSAPQTEDEARRIACNCQLGFDPVSKLYKLLKLSCIYDRDIDDSGKVKLRRRRSSVYFEILTIGVDSCWRIIDSPSPLRFGHRGLCVDGVMYGLESMSKKPLNWFLTAFHVAEERFLSVPLPQDFENRPPTLDDWRFSSLELQRFFPGPGPVLTSFGPGTTSHIDRYTYGGGNKVGGEEMEGRWETTEILNLPDQCLFPQGILPDGKVLLADNRVPVMLRDYRGPEPGRLSLYDPVERKLAVINWNGPCNTVAPHGDFYYLEENILSLKRLTSRRN